MNTASKSIPVKANTPSIGVTLARTCFKGVELEISHHDKKSSFCRYRSETKLPLLSQLLPRIHDRALDGVSGVVANNTAAQSVPALLCSGRIDRWCG